MKSSGKRPAGREGGLRLIDPREGGVAFRLDRFDGRMPFSEAARFNYFTILWIQEGEGEFHADLFDGRFTGPALLFFNPYQTFFVSAGGRGRGRSLQFHANFFCIEAHHAEVGCNGVLFNDIYGEPQVRLNRVLGEEFEGLLEEMEREARSEGLAQAEALVSFLKLFLIKATRLKLEQQQPGASPGAAPAPEILARLKGMIEEEFRAKHGPAEYASALHITPKALGKLVKAHFGRTLTELIRERVMKHAKWQLLHTQRTVKEIAWEAGFEDELYFSRLFKRAAGCSPTAFREFETAIRGGGNLSMRPRLGSIVD